jgi:nitrous oxide reductase accessory protein NosL
MRRKTIMVLVFVVAAAAVFMGASWPDIQQAPSCKYCGMDREMFSHSRMLIEYEDGTATGTCSLHCAAIELSLTIEKTPKTLWVADYAAKKLIDAEKAFWVVGGGKPGVMTKRAKWAFEAKTDAETFIKDNGGSLVSFDEAIKTAYEDMYQDAKMIREKRKMKMNDAMEHHHH